MRHDNERLVDRVSLTRQPRTRLCLILLGCFATPLGIISQSVAGEDDLPDLARPTEMKPIVSTPATPAQAKPKPATAGGERAVLALPGITTPAAPRPSVATPPVSTTPTEVATPDRLQLDAPVEMNGSLSPLTPLPRVSPSPSPGPGRSPRPLTLDSTSDEPVPIDGPVVRSFPELKRPATPRSVDSPSATPTQKRGRLFGLFPGPAPAAASAPAPHSTKAVDSSMGGKPSLPGRSSVESPPLDAASETALKRRIEKQAREAVGDRARSVEVRVVGKAAVVQARGVKLLQKRAVRKSLEGIPALSGLRSTIEVLD